MKEEGGSEGRREREEMARAGSMGDLKESRRYKMVKSESRKAGLQQERRNLHLHFHEI